MKIDEFSLITIEINNINGLVIDLFLIGGYLKNRSFNRSIFSIYLSSRYFYIDILFMRLIIFDPDYLR